MYTVEMEVKIKVSGQLNTWQLQILPTYVWYQSSAMKWMRSAIFWDITQHNVVIPDKLSLGKELPHNAAYYPRRLQISLPTKQQTMKAYKRGGGKYLLEYG